jgi:glutamine amidotransferase-like uncharacterized protein
MKKIFVYDNSYDNYSSFAALFNWCQQYFSQFYNLSVEGIKSEEIYKLDNEDAIAFFMPGGRSKNYQNNLSPDKVKIIDKFVNNGGHLSVCCGSTYWLAREIFFDTGHQKIEATNSSYFTFFDTLKGPLNELAKPFEETPTVLTIDVGDEFKDIGTYYHGGPKISLQNDMSTIAKFSNTDIPAIVSIRYNSGYIYASSPHLEFTQKALYNFKNLLKHYSLMPESIDTNVLNYIYEPLYYELLSFKKK